MAHSVSRQRRFARPVWAAWVLANVAGEVVGFGAAGTAMALAGGAVEQATGPAALGVGVLLVVLAGVVEGSAAGYAQWRVLRRVLPGLRAASWTAASVAGGTLAWGAGMAIGTTAADLLGPESVSPSARLMVSGGAVIGLVAGALLSVTQWLVLRRHALRAGWWVPAHAAGWAVGMVVAMAGMDRVFASDTLAVQIGGGTLVGLAMGAAAAGITGFALVRVVPFPGPFPGSTTIATTPEDMNRGGRYTGTPRQAPPLGH